MARGQHSTLGELKSKQHEALRKRIVAAAGRIVRSSGFQALTMRKLAETLDCSPMTIYAFFRDKQELQSVIALELFAGLARDLDKDASSDPLETLREGCLRYVKWGVTNPAEYRILFMTPRDVPPSGRLSREELLAANAAFAINVRRVQACVDRGLLVGDAFDVATTIWTVLHGVVSLLITLPAFPFGDDAQYIQRSIDVTLRSFRPNLLTCRGGTS